jgi:hypothetical protein
MRELISQDTATTSVSPQGSIRSSEDDLYAKAMERLKYLTWVHETGLGPIPVRFRCSSYMSSTPASQDPILLDKIGALQYNWMNG